jgi:hypothetical protein
MKKIALLILLFLIILAYSTLKLASQEYDGIYYKSGDRQAKKVENDNSSTDNSQIINNKAQQISLKYDFKIPKNPKAILNSKGFTIGPNFFYCLADGGGWGLEGSFPVAKKTRNIAMHLGYNRWSTTYFEEKNADEWKFPNCQIIICGLRYFPMIKPYRGFFIGESVNYATGNFTEKNYGAKGSFSEVNFIFEIGERFVLANHLFIQGSFGLGFSLLSSVNMQISAPDNDQPETGNMVGDGTLIIGYYF